MDRASAADELDRNQNSLHNLLFMATVGVQNENAGITVVRQLIAVKEIKVVRDKRAAFSPAQRRMIFVRPTKHVIMRCGTDIEAAPGKDGFNARPDRLIEVELRPTIDSTCGNETPV